MYLVCYDYPSNSIIRLPYANFHYPYDIELSNDEKLLFIYDINGFPPFLTIINLEKEKVEFATFKSSWPMKFKNLTKTI